MKQCWVQKIVKHFRISGGIHRRIEKLKPASKIVAHPLRANDIKGNNHTYSYILVDPNIAARLFVQFLRTHFLNDTFLVPFSFLRVITHGIMGRHIESTILCGISENSK